MILERTWKNMEETGAKDYLDQLPMWANKKNSLKDVRVFLDRMGAPDRKIPAVHVAGTNGKGSVCAFMTSVLEKAGFRTGTFISPHLVEIRERFLINGELVENGIFEEAFREVKKAAEAMMKEGFCHPTFFEFLFYMAMVIFAKEKVDVMVIETGLGGRLDATNVLEKPAVCVITSISKDHMQYLGTTIPEIAGEKAGIIKSGVPVVFDDSDAEAGAVIRNRAKKMNAQCFPVSDLLYEAVNGAKEGSGCLCLKEKEDYGQASGCDCSELVFIVPFEAPYQAQNAFLAVTALRVLRTYGGIFERLADEVIQDGIREARWPGRMERAAENIYLDGAHNPGGIAAFIQAAGKIQERTGKKPWLLFAAVSDKEYETMAKELCEGLDWCGIGVVHMNSDRGLSAERLSQVFKKYASCDVVSFEDTKTAISQMKQTAGEGILFCAGSLYLIGELKVHLEEERSKIH